ncbi:MAG: EF-hand domain-containing protein [Clostridiales bacterium]|jgi:hypothetical protein|nr:EF-hand domain-containing protein [Eubacteriales bacterium]MDH7567234.1 EF-hand domain-containing protein [Clostridiales bacterium]
MIGSVDYSQNYWDIYASYRTRNAASANSTADSGTETTAAETTTTETAALDESTGTQRQSESYSPEEHMKMMRGGMQGMRPIGPPPGGAQGLQDMLSQADSDEDGSVTKEEYENLISQSNDENTLSTEDFFSIFDSNGDGKITSADLEKAQESGMQGMKLMGPPPDASGISAAGPAQGLQGSQSTAENGADSSESEMTMWILNALKAYKQSANYSEYGLQQESSLNQTL